MSHVSEALRALEDACRVHPMYSTVLRTGGKIILGKGQIEKPDYLLIGEAPGNTENKDELRRPFCGRSGEILDKWLNGKSYAVINSVPMIPLDDGDKIRAPTDEEIAYFRPHVKALLQAIEPKFVICVGKTAAKSLEKEFNNSSWSGKTGFIYHPAYFLRSGSEGLEDWDLLMRRQPTEEKKAQVKLVNFIINKQIAEDYGHKEMISGILGGLHYFAKKAGVYFRDINAKDECIIGDKKARVFTRDIFMDEDMLVHEDYYQANPDVQLFITCKIKGGSFYYVGYADRALVEDTRVVQMVGEDSEKASESIRRVFAEQYKPMSNLLEIYVDEAEKEEDATMQSYVPLHLHTEYSVLDAFGTPAYIAEMLKRKGFIGAAITDHGTMGGIWDFQKQLLAKGLKPIIGIEAYIKIPELEDRLHIIMLAKNQEGYKNILKLQAKAVREHFHYKPVIKYEELVESHNGIIIMTACANGIINKLFALGKDQLAEDYFVAMKSLVDEDFYAEIMITTVVRTQELNQKLVALARKYNVKLVFTTDCHYSLKEDRKFHEALRAIDFKKKYGEAGYGDDCFYLMTDKDIAERIALNPENRWMADVIDEAKKTTMEILNKCNFELRKPEEIDTLPKFIVPENLKAEFEDWKKTRMEIVVKEWGLS